MNRLNRMTGRLVTAKKAATNNGPVKNEAGKPRRDKMNPDKTANTIMTPFTAVTLTPKVREFPMKDRYSARFAHWSRDGAGRQKFSGWQGVIWSPLPALEAPLTSHFSPLTNHFSLITSPLGSAQLERSFLPVF